jgi:DNA polymerase-3 subunit delta'
MSAPLLGQGPRWQALVRRARALRLPHALVIEGPPGTGKSTAARELAAALLCTSEAADAPCGTCGACVKVAAGQHPDVHLLTVPEDRRDIPLESVRALQEVLGRLPVEGRARVVVVDPAERLNDQGQNALLKTLEEPGRATFLLLATRRPEALLETVRSRTERVRIFPLEPARIASALAAPELGLSPDRQATIAAAVRGSLGEARRLAAAGVVALDDIAARALNGDAAPSALAREALADAEGRAASELRARAVLAFLAARARAALAAGLEPPVPALAPGPAGPYPFSPERWVEALDAVAAAEDDLGLEIGALPVLTELFLRVQEAAHGGGASDPDPWL